MMGKKSKALMLQLSQCAQENELLRTKVASLENQLQQNSDELNNANRELNNAKRKLEDYRVRQESIVSALTEAHNTRERIIKEAKAEANGIEADANLHRTALLDEAQAELEKARAEADELLRSANAEAERIHETAVHDAKQMSDEAIDEANDIIEMAKSQASELKAEAERKVLERNEQLSKLNAEIRERAECALKQAEMYAEALKMIADSDASIKKQNDCIENDHLKKCENACTASVQYANASNNAGVNCVTEKSRTAVPITPCGKSSPCCSSKNKANGADSKKADVGKTNSTVNAVNEICTSDETLSEPDLEKNDEGEYGLHDNETDYKPVQISNEVTSAAALPDEYTSVADLMKNIYTIEGRELPQVENDASADTGEGTPLADEGSNDAVETLPVDMNLDEILKEILPDNN